MTPKFADGAAVKLLTNGKQGTIIKAAYPTHGVWCYETTMQAGLVSESDLIEV